MAKINIKKNYLIHSLLHFFCFLSSSSHCLLHVVKVTFVTLEFSKDTVPSNFLAPIQISQTQGDISDGPSIVLPAGFPIIFQVFFFNAKWTTLENVTNLIVCCLLLNHTLPEKKFSYLWYVISHSFQHIQVQYPIYF